MRLIVPFPPGGGTDIMGRMVAQRLNDAFGGTPEQVTAVLLEETERWAKVVKAANVRLD